MPGTRTEASTLASARGFSIFRPNSSSPSGFIGQGSAMRMYSCGVTPHMRRRVALRAVAAGALRQAVDARGEGIARGFDHQAGGFRAFGVAQQDAVHAGGQGLLDHPGIGAHGVGGAGDRQGDDHRRGLVAGAGRAGFHQAAHEFPQFLEVERAVLHFIGDVVGLGGRHLLALLIAAAADLRVIDRLVLEPHVDDAVDVLAGAGGLLRHLRHRRIGAAAPVAGRWPTSRSAWRPPCRPAKSFSSSWNLLREFCVGCCRSRVVKASAADWRSRPARL